MSTTLIKGAAGSGKTEVALRRAAASDKIPIEIYVPTHKLAEECESRLHAINHAKRIHVICGRDYRPDGKSHLCKKHRQANDLAKSGHPVFPMLCLQSAGRKMPPIKCKHYDACPYIQQYGRAADIYIYTHAFLPLQRIMLEQREPCGVIIDESFLPSMVERVEFSITLLSRRDLPADAKQLCAELAQAIQHDMGAIRGIIDTAIMSGACRAARKALRRTAKGIKPNMPERQFKAQLERTVTFKPVLTLLEHLARSCNCRHQPQSIDVDHATGQITLHHRKSITRFTGQPLAEGPAPVPQIVLLDASASLVVAKKFFPDVAFQELPLERDAHVIQCVSTRCSTTSLVPGKNTDKKSKADARRKLNDIQTLLDRLAAEGRRVLIVGPSAVVGNPNAAKPIKPLLKCPTGSEFAHFNALRGIDRWKDFDTVIIIGRNQPSVKAVEDIARAIFYDDPEPLLLAGEWAEEVRGYRFRGGDRGVSVQVHPDPRIQAIVEQIRESESLQAIDRIRLIHNAEPLSLIHISEPTRPY